MTDADRAKLAQAEALIREVMKPLNTRTHECPTCGLSKKENWLDTNMKEMLSACVQRLVRVQRETKFYEEKLAAVAPSALDEARKTRTPGGGPVATFPVVRRRHLEPHAG